MNSSAKAIGVSALRGLIAVALLVLAPTVGQATVVRYETVLGDIDVRLYDTATPASVTHFINYLSNWDDTFFHRSVPGFIVQGGGFTFSDATGVSSTPSVAEVVNEPGISNLRGTIAYAKLGGQPNSATNQWFFNLANNSGNLDAQNSGFTVFGRVIGDGMDVVDAIAALNIVNGGGVFSSLPIVGELGSSYLDENFVNVTTITELMFDDADYNFDGIVDSSDYTVWRDSEGSTTQAEADGNGDGVVDLLDYNLWVANFGNVSSGGAVSTAVPEPTTAFLAFCGCLLGVRRRS